MKRKKARVDKDYCAACGACMKECPKKAIKIHKGLFAVIDIENCIGCGKCEKICPASVITLIKSKEEK
ncbi:ATP-binding protein [Oceanirhabdus sp. W0125-5]|uniref:ATP-binding protein n=1 Tax=Oceanirhabdus sp. W0125-5 TaxID=2999116 RepID=UPI0022F34886|nr:4Fe-4S dicluster domain-containing protein [Oceanirhabdus sp. W0125-5]WBW95163.1 4Fe-4S binding protein [Oceanirhabdus sp. W0125-5]